MMDGYGPGYGQRRNGYARLPDAGLRPRLWHMRGYGRDNDQGQGYGPGYHMRGGGGGYGPGYMHSYGYGHGMMGW